MDSGKGFSFIEALNYHVWQPCNMKCGYCFAEFAGTVAKLRQDKELLKQRALKVVQAAADAGVKKITFVGGEPTLCPWLAELLELSRRLGLVTMLVTNGSRIDAPWLEKHAGLLDWVAVSVDSLDKNTNSAIGRFVGRSLIPDDLYYRQLFARLSVSGIRIKINTVVSAFNWQENFSEFLAEVQPERWKVLQALHIRGENDNAFPHSSTSPEQFETFVQRHREVALGLTLAAEDNESMIGSYLMVDPLGRFFTNIGNVHKYSRPIWQCGWDAARNEIEVSRKKFLARGGLYNW